MRTRKRPIVLLLPILLLSVASAACSILAENRGPAAAVEPHPAGPSPDDVRIETRLLQEFERWQGTPHRLGGSTFDGVDCSGFVRKVYRHAFAVNLPRTTRRQVRHGKPVHGGDLKPGDLVFFRPPGYPRHVGIYLSRNRFMHASKSRGVIVSEIGPDYWAKYFWTARRILPESKRVPERSKIGAQSR